ncbi:MAG: hypothetical protein AAF526_08630, partial [Pseudomonadota bacterium]
LAIVSTTSIPSSAPDNLGSTMDPNAKGVPIGRRSPLRRGPYSTPIHIPAGSLSLGCQFGVDVDPGIPGFIGPQ